MSLTLRGAISTRLTGWPEPLSNLFQGLQTYARVEQAQLEQQKSEEQKTALERNLKTGVHSVKNNLQQARKRLDVQDRTIELAYGITESLRRGF